MAKPKKTRLYMKTFTFNPVPHKYDYTLGRGPFGVASRFTHFPDLMLFVCRRSYWRVCTRRQFGGFKKNAWYGHKVNRKEFPKSVGKGSTPFQALKDYLKKKGIVE